MCLLIGVKSVYCVSIVYNFYAGCTRVAPDCARSTTVIKKERRLTTLKKVCTIELDKYKSVRVVNPSVPIPTLHPHLFGEIIINGGNESRRNYLFEMILLLLVIVKERWRYLSISDESMLAA